MARLTAESPSRNTTRQATYLLLTLTLAGVALLWSTAALQAGAATTAPEVYFVGSAPGLIEAPSKTRPSGQAPDAELGAPLAATLSAEEQLGAKALARLSYPWQQLNPQWEIVFLPERTGFYGLTKVSERRIEVYVRLDRDVDFLTHVIAHELGHAVDVSLNDRHDRERWRNQRNLQDAPWWPNDAASDFATGAGDFAESFAAWQTGGSFYRGELADSPGAQDLALLRELAET